MSPWCALLWCQPSTTAPFSGPHWDHANTEVLMHGIHKFLQLLMVSILESDMCSENWLALCGSVFSLPHRNSFTIERPGVCAGKKEYY